MDRCPICDDNTAKIFRCKVNLFYGTSFDLVECGNCGVMRFDPLPTQSQLAAFYSASYYDFDRSRQEGKGLAFARQLRRWKKKGRFLDVGCATGFFINGIRSHSDWEVYGTDTGESAVRYAREKLHLNVVHGDLADAAFQEAFFDYIHVNNVLEHVLDPVSLLAECRRIIKPDGILFLSVPNGSNDTLDLIDFYNTERIPSRSKNGHIFFFPARTMIMLLEETGFVIKKKKTYSLKRGLRSLGYLPRKRNWKAAYYTRTSPQAEEPLEIITTRKKKKHSDLYYILRFIQGNLQMIPGLHDFGLDFLFILKPGA